MRWRFGECELDRATRVLRRAGRTEALTPKALGLLELLLDRLPAAVSRRELHDVLWPDAVVSESTIDSLVSEVRRAIGDTPRGRHIRTIRGFGYAFSGAAETQPEAGDASHRVDAGLRLVWGERVLALSSGENVLGRGADAAICLDAPSVSRHHARIRVTGPRATLEDLGSKNGTRLNEERVRAARELRDGDAIRLGAVLLLYRSLPSDGSTATDRELEGPSPP